MLAIREIRFIAGCYLTKKEAHSRCIYSPISRRAKSRQEECFSDTQSPGEAGEVGTVDAFPQKKSRWNTGRVLLLRISFAVPSGDVLKQLIDEPSVCPLMIPASCSPCKACGQCPHFPHHLRTPPAEAPSRNPGPGSMSGQATPSVLLSRDASRHRPARCHRWPPRPVAATSGGRSAPGSA